MMNLKYKVENYLIAVEYMLIQQKYQTMYFDNYPKPNHPTLSQKLDPASVSIFHQQSLTGFDPLQLNHRPYFNPRMTENTTVPSPAVNKNIEDLPKHYMGYPTGNTQNNNQQQQFFQVKNNVSFNTEFPNSNLNRENSEFIKRKDLIAQNSFLRTNQQQSPSQTKGFVGENGEKNNLRITIANEQKKSIQQGQKNPGSMNNISNSSANGYKEQDYGSLREQKQIGQEKQEKDKQAYWTSLNLMQHGFSENKLSSKPYAAGFKTGVENFEFDGRKGLEGCMNERSEQEKEKFTQDKDFLYNFQLKNVTSDLTIFGKQGNITNTTNHTNDQQKYYTPSLAKKSSEKDDSSFINKRGFNQLIDAKQNNILGERENNGCTLTDREIYKSPSFEALLSNDIVKQNFRSKLQSTIENQHQQQYQSGSNQNENKFNSSNSFLCQQNSKQSSLSFIPKDLQRNKSPSDFSFLPQPPAEKLSKHSRNYHQLIQNLEKKFSEQKKSSQSFQTREKTYIAQLCKKDEKIKRHQTIIENNKETINAMEQTIRQLKRKNLQVRDGSAQNNSQNDFVEELKKENFTLKEEIKKQRKRSMSIAEQAMIKQLSDKQEAKIKDLQRTLTEISKEKQNLSKQLIKLKQLNSSIQENYCNQIKDHQKTKQELQKIRQQKDQLNLTFQQKTESFNQLKTMFSNLEQKYEGSLQKLFIQQENFEKERNSFSEKTGENQKLKMKIERLEGEINFKTMKIKTLQEEFIEKSELIQKITSSENLLENKLQQMESNLLALTLALKNYETAKMSPKKVINNGEIKTLSSYPGKDFAQYKENLDLLELYHQKYTEIIGLFNLTQTSQKSSQNQQLFSSLTFMPHQNTESPSITPIKTLPSREYLIQQHSLLTQEIKKVLKDMKQLLNLLKECESDSQHKTQRLYELDKTMKKQVNKINLLMGEIHLKNMTIVDINHMQVEKDIFKLNEKYEILNHMVLGEV